MTTLAEALDAITSGRRADPLAPVTVVVPSHVAGLQLRRRLAGRGAFAGVRFETLPRVAELIAAGHLAAAGRRPLARPIGDYLTQELAAAAPGRFAALRGLPGFGRVLRSLFRRLRRGGLDPDDAELLRSADTRLADVLRLYAAFRARSERFYDDEDLLAAAAAALGDGAPTAELGAIYVVPPGALSAASAALLDALRRVAPAFVAIDEAPAGARSRFVLASDPASEAREAVREVLAALEDGLGLHEVAVFHGADRAYRKLLAEAFAAAGLPAASLPGAPLSETGAGRGVLALAALPLSDYARTAALDLLDAAPLRHELPAAGATVRLNPAAWARIARGAGVTHAAEGWQRRLETYAADQRAALEEPDRELSEGRRAALEGEIEGAADLGRFVAALAARLEPLRSPQPAARFIEAFKAVVHDYFRDGTAAMEAVLREVDQLGTIDAVGGVFSLASFVEALTANLEAAALRETAFGDGVLIADYRVAAGLSFRRVVLCGAYEGVFPASAETAPLIDDDAWQALRQRYPFVEDAALRLERARGAARRALGAATETAVWTAPLFEANGRREYYPAPLMLEAARARDASLVAASDLRRHASADGWLRRGDSPLTLALRGPVFDAAELRLRGADLLPQQGAAPPADEAVTRALRLLSARRSAVFSEYDGNLGALAAAGLRPAPATLSPSGLEAYATCGMRYLLGSVLRLRGVDDPEERDTLAAGARGTLVHSALEAFFREQQGRGRPAVGERWAEADRRRLLEIADAALDALRARGRAGREAFGAHERRMLHADLVAFLESDTAFRLETGAVPVAFEQRVPAHAVAGLTLAGLTDRVDRTPDGRRAWVIDDKTGTAADYAKIKDDPLAGGTRLQLPVYLAVAAGADATALYWFISRRGNFERIAYTPTPERTARFEATLAAIADGLAGGFFPAVSGGENEFYKRFENCRYCDFDRLCSRRRDAELAEKEGDASLAVWRRIALAAREETP